MKAATKGPAATLDVRGAAERTAASDPAATTSRIDTLTGGAPLAAAGVSVTLPPYTPALRPAVFTVTATWEGEASVVVPLAGETLNHAPPAGEDTAAADVKARLLTPSGSNVTFCTAGFAPPALAVNTNPPGSACRNGKSPGAVTRSETNTCCTGVAPEVLTSTLPV